MVKERNINWFHWFIGFICGFMVAVLTINFAHAAYEPFGDISLTEEQKLKVESFQLSSVYEGFFINEYIGMTDDCNYLVFYSVADECYYVWFMSNYATFRFVDRNPSKDLYCHDTQGACLPLDENFNVIYDPYNPPRSVDVASFVPGQFNTDPHSIRFIYSTTDISVSFVENENTTGAEIYISAGWIGVDIIPTPEPTFEEKVVDFLERILEAIKQLPDLILDGLRDILTSIFVPSTENVEADIEDLKKSIFDVVGFDVEELETTLSNFDEEPISDIYIDLEIAGQIQTVKVLDTKFLIVGVNYIRPILRGFIYLMMFFFVLNQVAHIIHINGFDKGGDSK